MQERRVLGITITDSGDRQLMSAAVYSQAPSYMISRRVTLTSSMFKIIGLLMTE